MKPKDYAGLVAPIVAVGAAVAGRYLAPGAFAEAMFWAGVVGAALVGVSNRYAAPPGAKPPLPPTNLNTILMVMGIAGLLGSGGFIAGCSALAPATVPTADATMCIILGGISGESVPQIAAQCGGLTEQAVADVLTHLLAADTGMPQSPDAGFAMHKQALTPLQRASVSVALNDWDGGGRDTGFR